MNSLRCYEILRQIMFEGPVSSNDLARNFSLSSRTIRNELQEWMPVIQKNGAVLVVQRGVGYRLEIEEPGRFDGFLENLRIQGQAPSTAVGRIRYMLKLLLDHSGEFVKQEILAEQLFVSRNTIAADFRKIKKFLKQYDLCLVKRPGYGISLKGKESDIRRMLVLMVKEDINGVISDQMDSIFKILVKTIGESRIKLSEMAFHELSVLLLVSIKRMETGRTMALDEAKFRHIQKETEYVAAGKIAVLLTEMFHVGFTEGEIGNIAIFLTCSRIFNLSEMPDYVIEEDIIGLAEKMMEAAGGYCGLDFKGDGELKTALITHLIPLLKRLRYHWPQKNPMLAEIKRRHILGYVIADGACRSLESYAHCQISEDEKGYLGIHFELALSGVYDNIDKNVLVVGSVGKAASQSLVRGIKKWFGEEDLKVNACDVTRLSEMDLQEYDCILSTSPLGDGILRPYLMIPQFLTERDYPVLRQFLTRPEKETIAREFSEKVCLLHLQSCEKKKILEEIALKMLWRYEKVSSDSMGFFTYVYEANASTSVAVISCSRREGGRYPICVAIPETEAVWDKRKADIVLFINVGRKLDRNFYYLIQAISEELSENSGSNLRDYGSALPL